MSGDDQGQTECEESGERPSGTRFPVVGIGASAGGLGALRKLFQAMPVDTGMAFVVIQHLDPTHESHMTELLQSSTDMPVVEVSEAMAVEPDHVYMIVPASDLVLEGGRLELRRPHPERYKRRPVDVFLRSLAAQLRERAVGVVLSGTGSNGTAGLHAIKAYGGMSIAQDPVTAAHAGMAESAIGAGVADYVLTLERMPETIMGYARHSYARHGELAPLSPRADEQKIEDILSLLRHRTGQDFRGYKRNTITRRIHRRMGLRGIDDLDGYSELLRAQPPEIDALLQDLRIGVTGFFRDPDSWQALREYVVRPLIAEREPGSTVRAWAPGCASGEEAYSLAIAFFEEAEAAGKNLELQIFASDVVASAVEIGRIGWFSDAIADDMTEEQLSRFFHKQADGYSVVQHLRDTVTFAAHNLLNDPPFSRMDLISCRNLLIYLEAGVQRKVLSLLRFALRDRGFLFLGNAETTRDNEHFERVSGKHCIYRASGTKQRALVDLPVLGAYGQAVNPGAPESAEASPRNHHRPADFAQRMLLKHYAPASVLVDSRYYIHYFHGPTDFYLAQPDGEPTHNLMAMARSHLATPLRAALRNAGQSSEPVTMSGRVQRDGRYVAVQVSVTPVSTRDEIPMLLVSFQDAEPAAEAADAARLPDDGNFRSEQALEDELRSTQEELYSSIRELESSNEELKASNEEVTSMNEELQSTNEELESSKEELQSLNEELSTVNNQLESKVEELKRSNNDLSNLLSSTDIATLHLDDQFCIRWLTRSAQELLSIIDSDVGRPIQQLADRFGESYLIEDARSVIDDLSPRERLIQSEGGRWYRRRIQPYRTQDNRIYGVVATFSDVTELKEHEEQLEQRVAERTAELEQTIQRLRRLATELNTVEQRERRQIASRLHDDCQQLLAAAKLKLAGVTKSAAGEKPAIQANEAVSYIDQAVDSMRSLAAELIPPVAYNEGVVPALKWLANSMCDRYGLELEVDTHTDAAESLSDDLRAFVYQAIRELVFNVVKHAGTDQAKVDLSDAEGYLRIRVADDGHGCDPEAVAGQKGGYGIASMRERVIGMGGRFDLRSNGEKGGCCVTIDVPLGQSDK